MDAHPPDIDEDYHQAFSILCHICCTAAMNYFIDNCITDRRLPLPRSSIGTYSGLGQIWERFYKAQWMFTPLVFGTATYQSLMPREQILPILCDQTPLAGSETRDTVLYKASSNQCCVGSNFMSSVKSGDIALKLFRSSSREAWDNETRAYRDPVSVTPVSLYILTDAVLGDRLPDFEGPIRDMSKEIGLFRIHHAAPIVGHLHQVRKRQSFKTIWPWPRFGEGWRA
ncbi:hypothetical protein VTK26DRAFT_91 [Humicola hyalothermophila]